MPIPYFSRPVSRLVLGSIPLERSKLDDAFELIDEYVRLGGNAIDTANIYGPDRHWLVGEYLRQRGRDTLVVMDKCCHPSGDRKRVTRADMFSDLEQDLERMELGSLEFFVLHRDDPDVPAGEIVSWLNELKEQGKIEAFGGSNWHHRRVAAANEYAAEHSLQGFSVSSSNLALGVPNEPMWAGAYTLDVDARGWYEKNDIPLFSWSSGSGGFFAYVDSSDVHRVYDSEENFARRERAEEVAKKHGASAAQIAVAWTLNQPLNVHAIIGPRTPTEVRENFDVANLALTKEELAFLELGDR